jgi:hypothetical protein
VVFILRNNKLQIALGILGYTSFMVMMEDLLATVDSKNSRFKDLQFVGLFLAAVAFRILFRVRFHSLLDLLGTGVVFQLLFIVLRVLK